MQRAAAHGHERAEAEEEVGEGVEGAVEGDVDRNDLVRREGERRLRRDRLEADARLVGDPLELEQDPGMSGVLGIAVPSRKMSATAIGCVSSWAAVAASAARSSACVETISSSRRVDLALPRADDHEVAAAA